MSYTALMNAKRIFLSGPMTGYDKYNWPKFDDIAKMLRSRGLAVVNPAEIDRHYKKEDVEDRGPKFKQMIEEQQSAEKTCDAILLLDGWQRSPGALLELKTALQLGLTIFLEEDLNKLETIAK